MSDDSMFTNKKVNVDYSQRCDEMSFSTFIGASIKLLDSHNNASVQRARFSLFQSLLFSMWTLSPLNEMAWNIKHDGLSNVLKCSLEVPTWNTWKAQTVMKFEDFSSRMFVCVQCTLGALLWEFESKCYVFHSLKTKTANSIYFLCFHLQ